MFDEKYPEVDPNKRTAQQIWEERYAGKNFLFGKEPCLLLKNHIGALLKGKTFDIAMGEGRNSVFLAQNGFEVEGIDCSKAAIEKVGQLAAEKNAVVQAKVQNLDFFLMPLMKYQTVIMTYYKPLPRFFSEVRRGLVMGGTFALEAYTTEHIRNLKSPNPNIDFDQCYKANEVLFGLKDFHILYYKEIPDGDSYLVQAIAQKQRA